MSQVPKFWTTGSNWELLEMGADGKFFEVATIRVYKVGSKEAEKNRRMIMASPDLFEACQLALCALELPINSADGKFTLKGDAIKKLRRAIARVRGNIR